MAADGAGESTFWASAGVSGHDRWVLLSRGACVVVRRTVCQYALGDRLEPPDDHAAGLCPGAWPVDSQLCAGAAQGVSERPRNSAEELQDVCAVGCVASIGS